MLKRPYSHDDSVNVFKNLDDATGMIEFGHLTHAGLRRELNEDTYYGDSELGLWLVADGMGGHEYGEVASALARETIVREIRDGTPLAQAIRIADEEIIRTSRRRNDALPMGTTVSRRASEATASRWPGWATAGCTCGAMANWRSSRRITATCRN